MAPKKLIKKAQKKLESSKPAPAPIFAPSKKKAKGCNSCEHCSCK